MSDTTWTPVTEGLPVVPDGADCVTVLVTLRPPPRGQPNPMGTRRVELAEYMSAAGTWGTAVALWTGADGLTLREGWYQGGVFMAEDVLAWMPLPDPCRPSGHGDIDAARDWLVAQFGPGHQLRAVRRQYGLLLELENRRDGRHG